MDVEEFIKFLEVTFSNLSKDLDLKHMKLEDIELKVAEKFQDIDYQIFKAAYKNNPQEYMAFLVVFLMEPDKEISRKLWSLYSDLMYHYVSEAQEVAIVPMLLYFGEKKWQPLPLAQLYSLSEQVPNFSFEFFDLLRSQHQII